MYIYIYIYILESTGALRAPLILLSKLPVEVLRVEVRAIDIRFDHVMFDAGPCSDSIQPFISAQAPEMQKPCGRQIIYKRSLQVSLSQKCVCRRGTHA